MPLRHLPILLALGLLGCPTTQPIDAGEDAFSLDATDHDDDGADANDQDATDHHDVGVDASRPDAFVCNCDDGISCTTDSCDARGQCVHVSTCADGEACRWGDAGEGCVATDACVDRSGCPDLPCQPSLGCWHGRCRYEWDDDLDGDGVGSVECGGPDCDPLDPAIPRAETCNSVDDDCNGATDDGVLGLATNMENCGACFHRCGTDACVGGSCVCDAGRVECPSEYGYIECATLGSEPNHCGSCENRCLDGSRCIAGVCEYRPDWMHGVDAVRVADPGRPASFLAPNGDVLLFTETRPTRLFHGDGRAADSITVAATPMHYLVRLDAAGNLVSATPVPRISWRFVVPTVDGVFVGGILASPFTLGSTTFAYANSIIYYVPRAGRVTWALRSDTSSYAAANGRGELIIGLGFGGEYGLRRIGADGVQLGEVRGDWYRYLRGLRTLPDGGVAVIVNALADELPLPVLGEPSYDRGIVVLHDADVRPLTAFHTEGTALLRERADRAAWLMARSSDGTIWETNVSGTSRRLAGPTFAFEGDYDGSGFALLTNGGGIERYREGAPTIIGFGSQPTGIREGAIWQEDGRFVLPGALFTITRIPLPPLP